MSVVLDAGALIALERRDRRMLALLAEIGEAEIGVYIPAGVLAQVWRGAPRQAPLNRLLKTRAAKVVPLDQAEAYRVGLILGRSGSSDVTDAHVALVAKPLGALVVTSDPGDITAIDPSLRIQAL
ncbi:MAG: PIN domain-containing protein [Propionicimonas sp.]